MPGIWGQSPHQGPSDPGDSVQRLDQRPMVLRRSRGYAPAPLKIGFKFARQILACRAELKNTLCLSRGDYAFLSHHIGDLENFETLQSFKEGIEQTNCPETSSMGRLVDAISSLLRLRDTTNYEGQAAIELEQIAYHDCTLKYQFDVSQDEGIIRARTVYRWARPP